MIVQVPADLVRGSYAQSATAAEARAFARGWQQALAAVAGLAPGVAPAVLPPPPPLLLAGAHPAPAASPAARPDEVRKLSCSARDTSLVSFPQRRAHEVAFKL